ncbi:DMT family transporter [Enterobacter sp. ENT03]|uniref:DMT family transporter n=1 Tax=Enterobacter sp. ENT03 TaxID=2854780 RepID=UPI0035291ABF
MAFTAGLGITLQTTLNSQLARGLGGDSVTAALFSFTAGAFTLGIYVLLRGGVFTSLAAIPSQPLWSLAGGLIGAGALFSYVVLAPKIGFSALLGLAIVGQLLSSQLIDHFGLLGAIRRPVSLVRLGGMLVMLTGLAVMLFGDKLSERFIH